MSDPDLIANMRDTFGDGAADGYLKLAGATRSLTYVWDAYVRAPVGSAQEVVLSTAMTQMMAGFRNHPDKAQEMIESLLALIQHMRMGSSYESWFESLGVDPTPGKERE